VLAREDGDAELPKFGESHSCGHPTQAWREVSRKDVGITGASQRSGLKTRLRQISTAPESETLDRLTAEGYARCRQRVMAD